MTKSDEIRRFILENVDSHPGDLASQTQKQFGISRQAANRHIRQLADNDQITFSGTTRNRRYSLKQNLWISNYSLNDSLEEGQLWSKDIRQHFENLPDNVFRIWRYSITEMLNNAIEHSKGQNLVIKIIKDSISDTVIIEDDGVGIFRKIKNECGLDDEKHAILELAKGKLTTDSSRHTGEGIFFTSRSVDFFSISSFGVDFCHEWRYSFDVLYSRSDLVEGTRVILKLNNNSTRNLQEVFDKFTTEDHKFSKTIVPIYLVIEQGDELISRSQAKRLLVRFEKFKTVILDFEGVDEIGQGFADEIFRVFQNEHPEITLGTLNANENVEKMVKRAMPSSDS